MEKGDGAREPSFRLAHVKDAAYNTALAHENPCLACLLVLCLMRHDPRVT